jgi:alkanesulfonate monooxygenase SsuD/methylene tetrahydromethanopterin reductase-like flavin-dependent oxidoreductase (luciferase family)
MVFLANTREDNSKRPYDSIRSIAQQSEADGFDSIWLPDHLLYRNPDQPTRGIWECWTMMAALAEATRRVEIGPLVSCNSLRNPGIAAKMATAVDEISHGRLILGVGAGWNEPEYQAFGIPFDHRVSRFAEALQIIKPLLRAGHVDFAGRYYQAKNCDNLPRGPRIEGPPLMVGCERKSPRMLKLTAEYADLWNTGYMGKPETMIEPIDKIRAACREVGRDPATLGITALVGLWFPDLQEKKPTFLDNPLIGSPQEIADAMLGYAQLGVQHIMFQIEPYGPEGRQRLTEALKLYRGMEQRLERPTIVHAR